MSTIESLLETAENSGPGVKQTALIGFSQGACLAVEFAARHPSRYGALAGLAGGLIGPPGKEFSYSGSLADTPVFLGCGDPDPHIPRTRVEETAEVLESLGARVEAQFYPGIGHTVNDNEIEHVRNLLRSMST
jgi:phospholipase/carboxylesterase